MSQILVFGDSIIYGAWDREGGWADRLKQFLHQQFLITGKYNLVYNLGVSGDTTKEILKRFEFETKQRIDKMEENVFIFSIGTNDASTYSNGKNIVDAANFENNIKQIIDKSKKFSNKIAFVGMTIVDESKTRPLTWATEIYCSEKERIRYDNLLGKICKKQKVHFIDVKNALSKGDLQDGEHPNSNGHKKIFEEVKAFFIKNKLI